MMQKQNKTQEQLELDNYRATGEVAYDESDEDFMDFSKTDKPMSNKKTTLADLNSFLKTFDPGQRRDENGRWTNEDGGYLEGKGDKYEIPENLVKVKFHTPMGAEDPNQEYQLKAIYPAWKQTFKDGTSQVYPSKADISPLNTGMTFPGIQSVELTDLIQVK